MCKQICKLWLLKQANPLFSCKTEEWSALSNTGPVQARLMTSVKYLLKGKEVFVVTCLFWLLLTLIGFPPLGYHAETFLVTNFVFWKYFPSTSDFSCFSAAEKQAARFTGGLCGFHSPQSGAGWWWWGAAQSKRRMTSPGKVHRTGSSRPICNPRGRLQVQFSNVWTVMHAEDETAKYFYRSHLSPELYCGTNCKITSNKRKIMCFSFITATLLPV